MVYARTVRFWNSAPPDGDGLVSLSEWDTCCCQLRNFDARNRVKNSFRPSRLHDMAQFFLSTSLVVCDDGDDGWYGGVER